MRDCMLSEYWLLILYVVLAVQKVIIIILNASDAWSCLLVGYIPSVTRIAKELNIHLCHFYYQTAEDTQGIVKNITILSICAALYSSLLLQEAAWSSELTATDDRRNSWNSAVPLYFWTVPFNSSAIVPCCCLTKTTHIVNDIMTDCKSIHKV